MPAVALRTVAARVAVVTPVVAHSAEAPQVVGLPVVARSWAEDLPVLVAVPSAVAPRVVGAPAEAQLAEVLPREGAPACASRVEAAHFSMLA